MDYTEQKSASTTLEEIIQHVLKYQNTGIWNSDQSLYTNTHHDLGMGPYHLKILKNLHFTRIKSNPGK